MSDARRANHQVVSIYGLYDPDSGVLAYVGKAVDAEKRLAGHIRDSARRNTPVYQWIRALTAQGKRPVLAIIQTCGPDDWTTVERSVIAESRAAGIALLNLAPGGNEPFCPTEVRAANGRRNARARVSTPRKARFYALKRTLGQALKRGEVSEATKAKLRAGIVKHPELLGSLSRYLG